MIFEQKEGDIVKEENWMNNPSLSNIAPEKLQMLVTLAEQARGKNQNELLPFLMSAAAQSRSSNMSFDSSEMEAIIDVMKIGKSPQEIQRIEKLCTLIKQFRR